MFNSHEVLELKVRQAPLRKTAIAIAVMLAGGGVPMRQALAAGCSLSGATFWNFAGSSDWTTASAWNPAVVPNSTGTNVCITNGIGTVALTTTQAVGNLQVGAGNGLSISTGLLSIGGGSLQNDGAIGVASYLQLAHDVTLSGGGTLTLAGGQIGTNGNAYTLTNQSTIQGSGVIGSNVGPLYQNLGFVNSGTVNANSSSGALSIQGNGGTLTNSGLLTATAGGTLSLTPSGAIVNAGGTITANAGTVNVGLSGQQMIQGGTLSTLNGGVLQTVGAAGLDGLTHGAITIGNGSTYTAGAAGSSTQTFSTGVLNLSSGSTLALGGALELAGDTTLAGPGTVVMNSGQIGTNGNGYLLTNQSTITGSGVIGSNATTYQNLGVANSGLIHANLAGQTLSVQGNGGSFSNTGVLQASNGATLTLATSAALTNAGGSVIASGTGSVVNLQGQYIFGGTLTTANGGTIQTVNSATLDGSTVANGAVTLTGGSTYTAGVAGSGTQTFVTGALQLGTSSSGSTIALGGALELVGNTTLSGAAGSVAMNAGQIGTNGNSYTLTNGMTIHGSGVIGSNATTYQNLSLANNGVINADASGKTLSIQGNGGSIVNNGVLTASNGGTLTLNTSAPINNSAGTIAVTGTGNTVNLTNETVQGGTLTATHGSLMQTVNAATLDGATLGAITLSSGSTYVAGAANSGTQTFSTGALSFGNGSGVALGGALELTGDLALNGSSGVVSMNAGQIGTNGNAYTLTNNLTIQGSGLIGSNNTTYQNLSLINNGTVAANLTGQTLSVQGNGGSVVNNALFSASNGGTLNLATSAPIDNSHGSIVATGAGSVVNLTNQTVQGGTLTTSAGGIMQTIGSAHLDGATQGAITFTDGSTYIAGAANSATPTYSTGVLTLGSGATISLGGALVLAGDTTLNGNGGTVTMNAGQIGTNGNAYTLTNNLRVQGSGVIGSNATTYQNLSVVNNGTIAANVAGKTLSVQGSGSLSGTGTLQAAGGALAIALNGPSTQGRLVVGGTGSSVSLGSSNLTITNDYTNAQSGSGNAFDRRAAVSGSGAILAGGNAAQAIVGNAISNGSSPDATLTIGNVRVGANTFNYAVTNTGTIGPTLRGAIQTSVNGANLTDSRLSGAGVTAANYNAGGPGGSTGNLGVVFTTGAAGALAPLSGQVLNLTSNFDNIGDQKLHIVIGSNAAAYSVAAGNAAAPVQIANQRVGGSSSQTLSISNTTPSSRYSEDLNASVGGQTGSATASGAIAGRLAGTSNTGSGAIIVAVDTASAGAKTGGVTLAYQTAGTVGGVANGLGAANVGTQVVTVNGNVYQAAAGALQSSALNFGTVQVGQSVSQNLIVRNTATGANGFVEDLNASFGAANGSSASLISGSGTLTGILAGSNSNAANGTMTVHVNTAAAGLVSGGIAVNYATAGAVAGISNGLGTAAVGSQNFGVSGTVQAVANVINQASPRVNTQLVDLGAVRVGAASPTGLVSVTNQSTASPQAALNANISSSGSPVTASGSFSLLAPGATSANQLAVGLDTATAGDFTGANARSATVAFVSDASNVGQCAPNCQLTLASQQVGVSGKVYAPAVAQLGAQVVDFGIVHKGDTVGPQAVSVTNAAAAAGLNDVLRGSFGAATGPFSASGSLLGVAAQATEASSFQAGLSTAHAGIFSGSATATFSSHDSDLADAALGSTSVTLKAQVNNYAQASFGVTAGSGVLTQVGSTYTLDLGDLILGRSALSDTLALFNSATGPADLLSGSFAMASTLPGFQLGGFSAFSGLAAGNAQNGLTVSFAGMALGSFDETIVLHADGSNASGYDAALGDTLLVLHGDVLSAPSVPAVPEPSTWFLTLAGLLTFFKLARSRHHAARQNG